MAFRLRMVGSLGREKAGVAVALLILYALGGGLPAWALAALAAALVSALCAAETVADLRATRE